MQFSEKGIEAFSNITPFKMIKNILDDPRYDLMNINHFEELNEKNKLTKSNNYYVLQILLFLSAIFL